MSFGNRTISMHLSRGAVGLGALAVSVAAPISPWWSIVLIPVAMIALKGCPICWTIGLVETVAMKVHAHYGADRIEAAIGRPSKPALLPSRQRLASGADV